MAKLVPYKAQTGNTIYVADIMVRSLDKYLAVFPNYDCIREVWLFGSVLEERCNKESDIDLLILYEGDRKDYRQLMRGVHYDCDVAMYDDILGMPVVDFYEGNETRIIHELNHHRLKPVGLSWLLKQPKVVLPRSYRSSFVLLYPDF